MTGDLAVTPRPPIVARTPSAPAAPNRPRAVALSVTPSAVEVRSASSAGRATFHEPNAARPKALLADGTVRIRAHRDEASARLVLQVLDRTTGELIEQYPPDQLLRLYAALRESLGPLVDERA
jgi:FlaG protein